MLILLFSVADYTQCISTHGHLPQTNHFFWTFHDSIKTYHNKYNYYTMNRSSVCIALSVAATVAVTRYAIQSHLCSKPSWLSALYACVSKKTVTEETPSPVSLNTDIVIPSLEHLYSVEQLSVDHLRYLFHEADTMHDLVQNQQTSARLHGVILANVFYEPSTRTSASFHTAMLRLGGHVVPIHASASSACKGESLYDTIRCLERYCDMIVLRHNVKGSAQEAAHISNVPLVNAGDGVGEHPTQALLDVYTIQRELGWGGLKGESERPWRVTFVGDLKHSRTVHSLSHLLARHFNVTFCFVSPVTLSLPTELSNKFKSYNTIMCDTTDLVKALAETDVLYVTRIQKERFATVEEYQTVQGAYCIDKQLLKTLPAESIILHPLPRVDELNTDVDTDPRAAYFRQMEYGLHMRMALLACLIESRRMNKKNSEC